MLFHFASNIWIFDHFLITSYTYLGGRIFRTFRTSRFFSLMLFSRPTPRCCKGTLWKNFKVEMDEEEIVCFPGLESAKKGTRTIVKRVSFAQSFCLLAGLLRNPGLFTTQRCIRAWDLLSLYNMLHGLCKNSDRKYFSSGKRGGRLSILTFCPSGCKITSSCVRGTDLRCPVSALVSKASFRCTRKLETFGATCLVSAHRVLLRFLPNLPNSFTYWFEVLDPLYGSNTYQFS